MNEKVKNEIDKACWHEQRQTLGNNNMKLKPYPEYRDSGIKWIGEIPEGWEVNKLKYILTPIIGKNVSEGQKNYLEIGDTDVKTKKYKKTDKLTVSSAKNVPKGTILISTVRPNRGGITITEKRINVSSAFCKLKLNNKFSFFYLNSESFFIYLSTKSTGSTYPTCKDEDIFNYLFLQPSEKEQTAIANFLDSKTTRIDALIGKDKKLIGLLKEKRTALINHLVTKGLDPNAKMKKVNLLTCHETPENWQIIRIKFVLRLSRGVDLSNDNFKEGNIPVYGSNGIIGYHNKAISKGPGVTVGRSGSVGEVNFVSEERYWAHNTSLYLQENYGNNVRYIYYLLLILDLKHLAAGSAVGTLNRNYIHDLFVFLPSKSEQQKLVDYLDKATAKIDKIIQKIEEKIKLLEEYKKSLIHHTVTGKVDVREI